MLNRMQGKTLLFLKQKGEKFKAVSGFQLKKLL